MDEQMPLNIPNGYLLSPDTDLVFLASRLRTTMEPIRRRIEIKEVAHHAAKILDAADLNGAARPASVIFDAVQAHAGHVSKILSGEHSCPLPVMSMAVTDDPNDGGRLALVFVQHKEFADAIDDMGIGEYYPYWDEGPKWPGVSGAEWTKRGRRWRSALRGTDPAKPTGMFKIDIGTAMPDISLLTEAESVFEALPSYESRVKAAMIPLMEGMVFDSHDELHAYMDSNEHRTRLEETLKPIELQDIAGGAL